MKRLLCCGAFLFVPFLFILGAHAETQPQKFQFNADLPLAQTLNVEVLSDDLIHFEFSNQSNPAFAPDKISTTPFIQRADFSGGQDIHPITGGFETHSARVLVDSKTLCMKVFDLAQNTLLTTLCSDTAHAGITLSQEQIQNIYGLGEEFKNPGVVNGDWMGRVRAPGGKFGNALVAYQGGAVANLQIPMMYAVGPGHLNYGLFIDGIYPLTWNFTSAMWKVSRDRALSTRAFRGYVFLGKDLPAIRTQFMDLLGRPPVPPKKAFGLWISEYGYRNWAEINDKLSTLRAHHFPIDGFVLDLYWYGGVTSNSPNSAIGRLDWDTENFPTPREHIASFEKDSGIGLMLIEQSYIAKNEKNFSLMQSQNFLAQTAPFAGAPVGTPNKTAIMDSWWGKGGMIDWTNDAAGAYWHDHGRQPLADMGITFHWTDLGEPESYLSENQYKGIDGFGSNQIDAHNIYNFKWHQSIFDGYNRNQENRRHFILSRSGGPGIQRFGSALWSGDIGSNLNSFSSHLNAQMHVSMSGIDYFGADVGGFHREALVGNMDELYTRWLAHATLFDVPVRPHTDNGSRQNNTSPDRIGDLKSNLFNVKQRYELAPYYYTLAHRAYQSGEPIVPPLVYFFQDDQNVRTIADEKMIGPSLLAVTSATPGETDRGVYLPKGDWIEYHTGRYCHSQGEWFGDFNFIENKIFRLPLFARAGAIIPVAHVDDQTMNILGKRLDGTIDSDFSVRVYEAKTPSEFTVIEDDGTTEAYQSGQFSRTRVTQDENLTTSRVTIDPAVGTYRQSPVARKYRIQWISPEHGRGKVTHVKFNGGDLHRYLTAIAFEKAKMGWFDDGIRGIFAKSDVIAVANSKNFEFIY